RRVVATTASSGDFAWKQHSGTKLCLDQDLGCDDTISDGSGDLTFSTGGAVNLPNASNLSATGVFADFGSLRLGGNQTNQLVASGSGHLQPLTIGVQGSDDNVSIQIEGAGTGGIILGANGTSISNSIRCTTTVDLASAAAGSCTADASV